MNFAWAPGNVVGSAVGGGLAELAGDAAAYSVVAGLCVVHLPRDSCPASAGLLRPRARVGACADSSPSPARSSSSIRSSSPRSLRFYPTSSRSSGSRRDRSGCSSRCMRWAESLGAIPAGPARDACGHPGHRARRARRCSRSRASRSGSSTATGCSTSPACSRASPARFCWTGALAWLVSGHPPSGAAR